MTMRDGERGERGFQKWVTKASTLKIRSNVIVTKLRGSMMAQSALSSRLTCGAKPWKHINSCFLITITSSYNYICLRLKINLHHLIFKELNVLLKKLNMSHSSLAMLCKIRMLVKFIISLPMYRTYIKMNILIFY